MSKKKEGKPTKARNQYGEWERAGGSGNLTYTQISKITKINVSYISRLLNGEKSNPSMNMLITLSRGMGISVSTLVRRIKMAEMKKMEEMRKRMREKREREREGGNKV